MQIGENIKNHLRARKLSIPDLEKKTGLSKDDIKGLIYKGSKNIKKLEIVANALDVPLSHLLPTITQLPFRHKIYILAATIVGKNFDALNISTNKDVFDEYAAQMYNYIVENQDKAEKEFLSYCEGMLRNAINVGAITKGEGS